MEKKVIAERVKCECGGTLVAVQQSTATHPFSVCQYGDYSPEVSFGQPYSDEPDHTTYVCERSGCERTYLHGEVIERAKADQCGEENGGKGTCRALIAAVQIVIDRGDRERDPYPLLSDTLDLPRVDAVPGDLLDWRLHRDGPFRATMIKTALAPASQYEPGDFRSVSVLSGMTEKRGDTSEEGRPVFITTVDLCMLTDRNWSKAASTGYLDRLVGNIPRVYDWDYLHIGGQPLDPLLVAVPEPSRYEDGDAFGNNTLSG